jgi:hypothetical protein
MADHERQWKDLCGACPEGWPMSARSLPASLPKATIPKVTIGELEANYSMYCKALRLLVREGRTLKKIQRTVCWHRLEQLHQCLPSQYKDPDYLFLLLRRETNRKAAGLPCPT